MAMTIKELNKFAKPLKLKVEQAPSIGYARVFYLGVSKKYIDIPRSSAFYFIKGWAWRGNGELGL